MLKLIDNGFDLKIWSIDWKKAKNKKVRSRCTFRSPLGLEYAKVINASKINLGLLSRLADDTITQRSVEIPACASFMLAERTEEHLQHFQEGIEAEYFSNHTELIEKINFYLLNDSKRNEIAANGFARCISSKYSYDDRMKEIMQQL
jgi:spore maturation protein CgeB